MSSDFSYTVEKTKGGTGSDAWTARAMMTDAGFSLSMNVRGETSKHARDALRYKLSELSKSISDLHSELEG